MMQLPASLRHQDTQPEGDSDEILELLTLLGQEPEPKLKTLRPRR